MTIPWARGLILEAIVAAGRRARRPEPVVYIYQLGSDGAESQAALE